MDMTLNPKTLVKHEITLILRDKRGFDISPALSITSHIWKLLLYHPIVYELFILISVVSECGVFDTRGQQAPGSLTDFVPAEASVCDVSSLCCFHN